MFNFLYAYYNPFVTATMQISYSKNGVTVLTINDGFKLKSSSSEMSKEISQFSPLASE